MGSGQLHIASSWCCVMDINCIWEVVQSGIANATNSAG